ncbi:MAG: response regulator [Candidatus Altiarchaeales archaeon ex4484_96]|nr:MAG: response regulator [Candidatus Altiarchaeales archaeon ex4484_96]
MNIMGKKVMILDDQEFSRATAITLLKNKGFKEFIECSDAQDALEKYKKTKPYFVITDIILPGMSGKEFLKKVLEFDPKARVFVMSVLSREEDMRDCLDLGSAGFLSKPLTENKIEHVIYALKHMGD